MVHSGSHLLNFGHFEVYVPSRAHLAPTKEAMLALSTKDTAPRGWLTISKDLSKRPDILYLVLAEELDKNGKPTTILQQFKVPALLARELREYLKTRPPTVKWLFSKGNCNKDLTEAQPYVGSIGRASFQARINRILREHKLGSYMSFRLAIMKHHREEAHMELSQGPL
jgi:hypothetical protein